MKTTSLQPERSLAWAHAKAAVRAYARDPSNSKAEEVRAAWSAIRRLDALAARPPSVPAGRRRPGGDG